MILLSGSTGLLGMHILFDLCQKGHEVRALFRSESRIESVKMLFKFYDPENFDTLWSKIHWFQADIEDEFGLEEAFYDIDLVIHAAAKVSFRNDNFRELVRVNRYGTANMVNLALKHKVKWFGHVSSTAAIGKKPGRENLNLNENAKWLSDVSVSGYALSKHLAEKEVWRGMEEGLQAAIVNPSVIFGPGNWDETSLTIFRAVERGLKFYAPGSNAFVDVRDVSKRLIYLMEQRITDQRYLVAGENMSFQKMTSAISKSLGKKEPSIPVRTWQMGLAWRLASFFSFITRKPTALTKDAAKSAFSFTSYSCDKINQIFPEPFISIDESVELVVRYRSWSEKINKVHNKLSE